jgi:myo-inositol-1(or 4)-monophosphatase
LSRPRVRVALDASSRAECEPRSDYELCRSQQMTHLEDNCHRPVRSARTETADPPDHELLLAAEHAVDIGARIFRQGRAHIGALIAKGDRDFATSVDLQIESAIRTSLATATPAIPFLGEEHGGGGAPGKPEWVLDPIDGTINFSRDSPLCTISLSLVTGGQPVLGIVDAPLLGERFIARRGGGAFLNGERISVSSVGVLHEAIVAVADFRVGVGSEEENRVHLALLARLAGTSLRVRMHGSAALDLAWLAAGRLNATVMLSNLPWDVTAGLLLVREAGGVVFDLDASDHRADSRFTLASEPSLAEPVRQLVRAAT